MEMKFKRATNLAAIDPSVRQLTRKQLRADIAEYKALLDARVSELCIHSFLSSHSCFFNGLLRLFGYSPLYSKVKLGHDFEVDFAWFDTGSDGPEWCLAEIESPTRSMFTKAGDPSAWLTHAIQQVCDWHSWIHDNGAYARSLMPYIEYPLGLVFIGRREELTSSTRKKLRRLCYGHRMSLEIHTLDWFISAAESVDNLIIPRRGGAWPVGMRALNHSDLARGLPPLAKGWMESPFARRAAKDNLKYRLQGRKYSYLGNEELREEQD
jgi:hypothetical protein